MRYPVPFAEGEPAQEGYEGPGLLFEAEHAEKPRVRFIRVHHEEVIATLGEAACEEGRDRAFAHAPLAAHCNFLDQVFLGPGTGVRLQISPTIFEAATASSRVRATQRPQRITASS